MVISILTGANQKQVISHFFTQITIIHQQNTTEITYRLAMMTTVLFFLRARIKKHILLPCKKTDANFPTACFLSKMPVYNPLF